MVNRVQSLDVWTRSGAPHDNVPNVDAKDFIVDRSKFRFPNRVPHNLWGHGGQQDRASRVFRVSRPEWNLNQEWSLDEELGEGSFGKAYLATSADTGRRYVIKFLKKADDSERTGWFNVLDQSYTGALVPSDGRAELTFLKSVPYEVFRHANLCQYVGIATDIPGVFPGNYASMIFMDAIPNGMLFDLLVSTKAKRGFEEDTMRRFAHDIINGMRFLAYHCITHGDLKPENLLIDDRARVIIIDFGTAKKHQDTSLLPHPNATTLMDHLKRQRLKQLKTKAIGMGIGEDKVKAADDEDEPEEAVIQMLLAPRFRLVCQAKDRPSGTKAYKPPENPPRRRNSCCGYESSREQPAGIYPPSGNYDCERADVFTVGLILCLLRWPRNPRVITKCGLAILAEGVDPSVWQTALSEGVEFTHELKSLVNAMLRKDPENRPGWAELSLACNEELPRKELNWLSLPLSAPLRFFQELKEHDGGIEKKLKSSGAAEALATYVRSFEGDAAAAFEEATTANDSKLSTCQLHDAMKKAKATHDLDVTELDLAALMCRFTGAETMESWQFEAMATKWSCPDHEVVPICGRKKSRYYAWNLLPCGISAEKECQQFVEVIRGKALREHPAEARFIKNMLARFSCGCIPASAKLFKYEPAPDEAKIRTSEDGLFHECFTIIKDDCQLRCNVFRMDSKIILESKLRSGSSVEELDMLGDIYATISNTWGQRVKTPVVLTEEWLLPAMQEETPYKVGRAEQAEKHAHVVLKHERNGTPVEMVPNGEIMIILSEEKDSYKVKWMSVEGWAKKRNLVDIEVVQPSAQNIALACELAKVPQVQTSRQDRDICTAVQ